MSTSHLFTVNDKPHPSAGLADGRIYAVLMDDEHYAAALVWGTLLNAADGGRPAWLVSGSDPQHFLSGDDVLAEDAAAALDAGRIGLFTLDAAALPLRRGTPSQQLLAEIEHYHLPQHSLLLVEHAERLFDKTAFDNDGALLRNWRNWAENHHARVLLLFRKQAEQAQELPARLLAAAHLLGGLARMRYADDMVRWEIINWFAGNTPLAGKSWRLAAGGDGRLTGHDILQAETAIEPTADEDVIYAMRSILDGNRVASGDWHWFDDAESLLAKAADAVAATVVLGFDRTTTLEQLARTIYALRRHNGSRLKIVVRELHVRLRYSQEALMIKLGANLVIPPELSYSRFLGMVSMVQGQRYARILPPSYEEAVAQTSHEQSQGYMTPRRFVAAVTRALDLGRSLSVQNALVGLPLAHGLTPVDALRYYAVKRSGDYATADENGVYIFLSACREADVDVALRNSFRLPVSDLFNSETRYLSTQTIRSAVDDLMVRIETEKMPDYTDDLAAIMAQEDLSNGGAPAQQPDANKPSARVRTAPPPARRQPLRLRAPRTDAQA